MIPASQGLVYSLALSRYRRGNGPHGERKYARQAAHQGQAEDAAAAALQGHPDQRRLHPARIRRAGAQSGVPHERRPRLPGDDDRAPPRRLRDRGVQQGRGRDQSQGSNRAWQGQGLSAVFYDGAGGVGGGS